jgi:hypothetical protein
MPTSHFMKSYFIHFLGTNYENTFHARKTKRNKSEGDRQEPEHKREKPDTPPYHLLNTFHSEAMFHPPKNEIKSVGPKFQKHLHYLLQAGAHNLADNHEIISLLIAFILSAFSPTRSPCASKLFRKGKSLQLVEHSPLNSPRNEWT